MKRVALVVFALLVVLVAIGVVFFVVKGRGAKNIVEEEDMSALIEVSLPDRPFVSLVPRKNGRWLDMVVSKLGRFDAETMEYEILFDVPVSGLQGTFGEIDLAGKEKIEREILVGTESSGNYYYYNGVENGKFSLKFRDKSGKLVAKFSSDFRFQKDPDEVVSLDGNFKYAFDDAFKGTIITMQTIGFPGELPGEIEEVAYGVFSEDSNIPGNVSLFSNNLFAWDGEKWNKLDGDKSLETGIFASVK